MIIQPNLPSGFVIFCDDIREEINEKLNFVGIYENGMNILAKPPVIIRQISVWVSLRADIRKNPLSGKIKIIRSDNDTEISSSDFSISSDILEDELRNLHPEPDSFIYWETTVRVNLIDLYLDRPCRLKVRAYSGDNEIRIGSLNISFQD
jgi:hypothetical protein